MAEPLENLAVRLEQDPFFLACPLKLFAQSAGLDDAQLAEGLGCSLETLVLVRLCRAPAGESSQFQQDIRRVAARYNVNTQVLTAAVRRGQALLHLREAGVGPAGTLRAARDAQTEREDDR